MKTFWQNIKRRATAIAVYLEQANKKGISNVAKSAYFRSATVLICTIIEGMVYQLVKMYSKKTGNIVGVKDEFKGLHQIPRNVFKEDAVFICKKIKKNINIDDKGVTFEILNRYLKRNKIITPSEFKQINYVRIERNKLHLQSLDTRDTGYTINKLKKVSKPADLLSKKIISKLSKKA
ncbi:MAG: hypothetical protein KJI70_00430 [Patescibacteria group bacterium]|nr:hypothetical protein [Patescibacteria group bacterium]